jgi:hypothetical protein
MAKPVDPGQGFFTSIWGNIKQILLWLEFLVDTIGTQLQAIDLLKQIVRDDLQEITDELKKIVADEQSFVDRAKHIRVHVIRADKIFSLWEEIRSGDLKTFVTDQIEPLGPTIAKALDDFLQSGRQVGATKTTGPGAAIINFIHKFVVAWSQVAAIVGVLKAIVPILQAIRTKLTEFESIIMPQTNPRVRLKKTISAREGKLHA